MTIWHFSSPFGAAANLFRQKKVLAGPRRRGEKKKKKEGLFARKIGVQVVGEDELGTTMKSVRHGSHKRSTSDNGIQEVVHNVSVVYIVLLFILTALLGKKRRQPIPLPKCSNHDDPRSYILLCRQVYKFGVRRRQRKLSDPPSSSFPLSQLEGTRMRKREKKMLSPAAQRRKQEWKSQSVHISNRPPDSHPQLIYYFSLSHTRGEDVAYWQKWAKFRLSRLLLRIVERGLWRPHSIQALLGASAHQSLVGRGH